MSLRAHINNEHSVPNKGTLELNGSFCYVRSARIEAIEH